MTSNRVISRLLIVSSLSTLCPFQKGHFNFAQRGLYYFALTLACPLLTFHSPQTTLAIGGNLDPDGLVYFCQSPWTTPASTTKPFCSSSPARRKMPSASFMLGITGSSSAWRLIRSQILAV